MLPSFPEQTVLGVVFVFPASVLFKFETDIIYVGPGAEPAVEIREVPGGPWIGATEVDGYAGNQVSLVYVGISSAVEWRILSQPTKFGVTGGTVRIPQSGTVPYGVFL